MSEEIERLAVARASTDEIARAAIEQGMTDARRTAGSRSPRAGPRSRRSCASSSLTAQGSSRLLRAPMKGVDPSSTRSLGGAS